jgi:NifU-like protein involved in Fe-S cluster formation
MNKTLFNILKDTQKTEEISSLRKAGYSEKAASILDQRLNWGAMDKPDIIAKHQSDCGDMLILYLKLDKQRISNATFEYIGCRGLEAAASALTEIIKGKTVQEALKTDFQDILSFLEGIPESKHECIHLALDTLREGIKNNVNC